MKRKKNDSEKKVIIPIHGLHKVIVDGKEYVPKKLDKENIILVRIDKKEHYERAKKISNKIAEKADLEEWLTYALMDMNLELLEKLEKKLKQKKFPKITTNKGCFEIRVGGIPICLRE